MTDPDPAALPATFRRQPGGVVLTVPTAVWARLRSDLLGRLERAGDLGPAEAAAARLYDALCADEAEHPAGALALDPGAVAVMGDPDLGDADHEPGQPVVFAPDEWAALRTAALIGLAQARGGAPARARAKLRGA
jgi:hypothetical protein